MADRSVTVNLIARVQGYTAGLATATAATKEFVGELDTMATKHREAFGRVTNVALGAGAALAGFAAYSVKAAYTFDKTMSQVQAVSGATSDQLGQLRDAAIETGKATAFSATDAAQAEAELAKAGLSTAQILGGALKGAVSLAAAGQLDMASAATDTATALNEFQLQGTAASHVADVLAAGANTSATDVSGLAMSLNQAGLVAHQTGLSLEDTVGTLSAMAQAGLAGSDAGTSLKTMLQALQAPSGKTADLMKQLGINAYDAAGKFIGITGLAEQLKDKLGGLTQQQRDNALAQIFGNDAVRAANVLYEQGADGLQKWITGVDKTGTASKVAAANMNNLSGDVEQLKGSLETLAINASGGVTSALRLMTQGTTGLLNMLISLPAPISETLTLLSGFGGVGLVAATGFVKARTAGRDFLNEIKGMGPSGEKAATALGKVGSVLGKGTVWGAAAFAAFEGVSALIGVFKDSGPVKHDIDALTDSLNDFANSGKITGEMAKVVGPSLSDFATRLVATNAAAVAAVHANSDLSAQVREFGNEGVDAARKVTLAHEAQATFTQDIQDYDAALTTLVNNGATKQAATAFEAMNAALQGQGFTLDQVNALFPQYITSSGNAAAAQKAMADSAVVVHTSLGTMVLSMDDAITKGEKLSDVLNGLSGANEDSTKAHIAATNALDALAKAVEHDTKATKDNKVSLNEDTVAGAKHVSALLDAIDAGKQQFQTTFQQKLATEGQTQALSDANKEYQTYLGKLAAALVAQGYNADQVQQLIDLNGKIPPTVTTTYNAPGLGTTYHQVDDYYNDTVKLDGKTVTTHFQATFGAGARSIGQNRWGGVYEHAATGLLSQAATYSATSPGRYMIAEPQTGGEAFIPKYGDFARSLGILSTAAAWYGQTLMPGYRGMTRGGDGASIANTRITQVYPQRADFTIADLEQLQRVQEIRDRIGV